MEKNTYYQFIFIISDDSMGSYLGQNFLVDTKVQNYIADKVRSIYEKNQLKCIVEIGPGKGAITKKIKDISNNFFVVEKDLEMKPYLSEILDAKQIIFADVLQTEISDFIDIDPNKILIVGNLPYYITSPIFRKFFAEGYQKYFGGFFMIQDEVGQKIQTIAKKKSFLRWLVNYSYDVIYCKTVGPKSFNPAPKVKSCLVEFCQKADQTAIDRDLLNEFLTLYSPFSRKTLGAITKILNKQEKKTFDIPESLQTKRLEELDRLDLGKFL